MPSDWRSLVQFTNTVSVVWHLIAPGGTRILRDPRHPDSAARLTAWDWPSQAVNGLRSDRIYPQGNKELSVARAQ
jgi:hypothetical protein